MQGDINPLHKRITATILLSVNCYSTRTAKSLGWPFTRLKLKVGTPGDSTVTLAFSIDQKKNKTVTLYTRLYGTALEQTELLLHRFLVGELAKICGTQWNGEIGFTR